MEKKKFRQDGGIPQDEASGLASFHFEGYELLEKLVKKSGTSGRVYLPSCWVGKKIKIVRMDKLTHEELSGNDAKK